MASFFSFSLLEVTICCCILLNSKKTKCKSYVEIFSTVFLFSKGESVNNMQNTAVTECSRNKYLFFKYCALPQHSTSWVTRRQKILTITNMKACPNLHGLWRNSHFCRALPLKKSYLKSITTLSFVNIHYLLALIPVFQTKKKL